MFGANLVKLSSVVWILELQISEKLNLLCNKYEVQTFGNAFYTNRKAKRNIKASVVPKKCEQLFNNFFCKVFELLGKKV